MVAKVERLYYTLKLTLATLTGSFSIPELGRRIELGVRQAKIPFSLISRMMIGPLTLIANVVVVNDEETTRTEAAKTCNRYLSTILTDISKVLSIRITLCYVSVQDILKIHS